MISAALGLLGIADWWTFSLWWALAPIGLLFLYGLLRANYEEYRKVERKAEELEQKVADTGKRQFVKDLLGRAREEGRPLKSYEKRARREKAEAAKEWVERTYALIEAAFDKGEAEHFRGEEIDRGFDPMDTCLPRLDRHIVRANFLDINPGFDPREWSQ